MVGAGLVAARLAIRGGGLIVDAAEVVELLDIPARHRHRMSVATMYVVLSRLESRGLVASAMGEATPERGGRAKRYFRVTAKGLRQVRTLQQTLVQLWRGVPQLQGATI